MSGGFSCAGGGVFSRSLAPATASAGQRAPSGSGRRSARAPREPAQPVRHGAACCARPGRPVANDREPRVAARTLIRLGVGICTRPSRRACSSSVASRWRASEYVYVFNSHLREQNASAPCGVAELGVQRQERQPATPVRSGRRRRGRGMGMGAPADVVGAAPPGRGLTARRRVPSVHQPQGHSKGGAGLPLGAVKRRTRA